MLRYQVWRKKKEDSHFQDQCNLICDPPQVAAPRQSKGFNQALWTKCQKRNNRQYISWNFICKFHSSFLNWKSRSEELQTNFLIHKLLSCYHFITLFLKWRSPTIIIQRTGHRDKIWDQMNGIATWTLCLQYHQITVIFIQLLSHLFFMCVCVGGGKYISNLLIGKMQSTL